MDPWLAGIVEQLRSRHGCHTVLLYGSRARGQATAGSDVDLACIRNEGPVVHDARDWQGVYLDVFVYPEAAILQPDESMLKLRGGKVLCEQGGMGTELLARVERLYEKGPRLLSRDEREVLEVWTRKMLDRLREAGPEDVLANYRRASLLVDLLEDYFAVRGRWYRGPKESFAWLAEHEPAVHDAFAEALAPGAGLDAIERLVRAVHPAEQAAAS